MSRLSVVIPVYNRATSVREAIDSTGAEGRSDVEVIVVDDGSVDGSAEAAEDALAGGAFTGQVIRQKNAGAGAARNTGVAHASGEWLAFLDSDDAWFAETLQRVMDVLDSGPEAGLIFLLTQDHAPDARPDQPTEGKPQQDLHRNFLSAVASDAAIRFASCNAVMSRELFDQLGGFPSEIRCSEDTDLFMRSGKDVPCLLLMGRPLVAHQLDGADSLSGNVRCVADGMQFLLRRAAAGVYGSPDDPLLRGMLARSAVYAARLAFASGYPRLAYSITLGQAGLILRGGQARWLPRLLLTPLASLIRPRSYRFRFSPS